MHHKVARIATFTPRSHSQRGPQLAVVLGLTLASIAAHAGDILDQEIDGEQPALGDRLSQDDIVGPDPLSLRKVRQHGLRIFTTPFNRHDGLGDGPINPTDKVSPGGRPTFPDHPFMLRMNGLDSQTCLECHGVASNRTIPPRFDIGGIGGFAQSAFPGVIEADFDDSDGLGHVGHVGRVINPPFNFGAGGIELLAKEMTHDLQDLANNLPPGQSVALVSKGIDYGTLQRTGAGALDLSQVEGIDDDLVVRPFGRTGCCATIREFDRGAMEFHHGIQPVEVVNEGIDADGDGVVNELTIGEMSALHIFQVALRPPKPEPLVGPAIIGEQKFDEIGCASCHVPTLQTESTHLPLTFPEVATDPYANTFYTLNLTRAYPGFAAAGSGVAVHLYADLKRHDMGPESAESDGNTEFTTARLWGIADTAPYMHDGRAVDLRAAIEAHGGEAASARTSFDNLSSADQAALLAFLRSLRTPKDASGDL